MADSATSSSPLQAVGYELVPRPRQGNTYQRTKYALRLILADGKEFTIPQAADARLEGSNTIVFLPGANQPKMYATLPSKQFEALKAEYDEKIKMLRKVPVGTVATSTTAKRITASITNTPSSASPPSNRKTSFLVREDKLLSSAQTPPFKRVPAVIDYSPFQQQKKARVVDESEIEVENDSLENSSSEENVMINPTFASRLKQPKPFVAKPLVFADSGTKSISRPTSLESIFDSPLQKLKQPIKIATPLQNSFSGAGWGVSSSVIPMKASNVHTTPVPARTAPSSLAPLHSSAPRLPSQKFLLQRSSSPPEDLTETENKKRGYPNSGFVCYCNAVVRTLVTCDTFEREISSDFWTEILRLRNRSFSDTPVFNGLRRCFQANRDNVLVNPSDLIRVHLDSRFRDTLVQHDAHEFLLAVLDKIQVELVADSVSNRENHGLFLSQLRHRIQMQFPTYDATKLVSGFILPTTRVFEATTQKTITCASCGSVRKAHPETHLAHSLDFTTEEESENPVNLEDLLAANMLDNSLREVKCEKCDEGKYGRVATRFVRIPRIFVLHLKRFRNDHGTTGKRQDRVIAPPLLSVSRVLASERYVADIPPITSPAPPLALERAEYELIAGVFHRGSRAQSGHYVTIAKDMSVEDDSKAWLKFDDLNVNPVHASWTLDEVAQRQGYLYFYRLANDC